MATALTGAKIEFPGEFTARDEAEMTMKGHLSNVIVRLGTDERFELHFIDPQRLSQELELDAKAGTPYFAEPGLVVIPEVTLPAIRATIERLAAGRYFHYLMPLAPDGPVSADRAAPEPTLVPAQ